jgi:hypothetical protein
LPSDRSMDENIYCRRFEGAWKLSGVSSLLTTITW